MQPILDAKCVECHQNPDENPPYRNVALQSANENSLNERRARQMVDRPLFRNINGWRYTTEKPGNNWMKPEYFAATNGLPTVEGGLGEMPGRPLGTSWRTPDVWMWQTIELPDDWQPQSLALRYFHDEDIVIYVNGRKVFGADGFNTNYQYAVIPLNEAAAFKPGINYIAANTHQTSGGQGVDFGLWTIKPGMDPSKRDNTLPPINEYADLPFSLKADPILDPSAKRNWPLSYLNLTNSRANKDGMFTANQTPVINWINVQDVPSMLPPYNAGAAKSGIMAMFDPNLAEGGKTHNDVKLTREELDKLALWIDLLVPAFGDYVEGNAWNEGEKRKFAYYELKKQQMHELDVVNNLLLVSYCEDGKLPPLPKEPNPYRNVALNVNAVDAESNEKPSSYPAASSNSVYENMKAYAASNAIDGKYENTGHGDRFPSWGPHNQVDALWWQVDFGKPIKTDQVVITIRADFPHDTFWKQCTIECSNGFTQQITLQKTGDRQVFTFPMQSNVTWLKLTNFVPDQPDGWAALTEVEVYGIDDKR